MVEQTREIVHKFNTVYNTDTLVMPDILLPTNDACRRLPGTDGKAKMSKSLGNCIYLSDTEEDVKKKVMSMYTDPNHLKVSDPGQVEGNTVFTYLDAFCKDEYFAEFWPDYKNLDEVKEHYKRGGLGDVKVKKFLNRVLEEELRPIRERRKRWEQDIPAVYEILKSGSEKAERMRIALINCNQDMVKENPDYCVRITGSDVYGKSKLDYFISVSSPYPVIATTSELLSTGADCKMTKLIVLDKTVESMTTFKQIIGR